MDKDKPSNSKRSKEYLEILGKVLLPIVVYAVIFFLTIFISSIFSSDEQPAKQVPFNENRDSEYHDAMESKNYNPNSDDGGGCNSPVCD